MNTEALKDVIYLRDTIVSKLGDRVQLVNDMDGHLHIHVTGGTDEEIDSIIKDMCASHGYNSTESKLRDSHVTVTTFDKV